MPNPDTNTAIPLKISKLVPQIILKYKYKKQGNYRMGYLAPINHFVVFVYNIIYLSYKHFRVHFHLYIIYPIKSVRIDLIHFNQSSLHNLVKFEPNGRKFGDFASSDWPSVHFNGYVLLWHSVFVDQYLPSNHVLASSNSERCVKSLTKVIDALGYI